MKILNKKCPFIKNKMYGELIYTILALTTVQLKSSIKLVRGMGNVQMDIASANLSMRGMHVILR
jgi:hypothetical protein